MVNLARLSTLLSYRLDSIPFKPVPNSLGLQGSPMGQSQVHTQDLSKSLNKTQHRNGSVTTLDVDPTAACYVAYSAPPILNQEFPPYDPALANIYRYRQQQGVNLGSWMVHEKWMTPSVFACASGSQASESDIAYGWTSQENARAILERHWDTFITKADFQYLSSIGINTVRLPIGYWNLGPEFTQGTMFEWVSRVYEHSWSRIRRAINEAGDLDIGVLVDLHGAPGSQNGQQHSGVSDGKTGLFSDQGNMDKTIQVLVFLMKELVSVNNVVGIQLLNEPAYDAGLEAFYTRCIEAMRAVSPAAKSFPLYVHDGFDLDRFSNFVAARQDFVVQDHHSYFVFTPSDSAESGSQHIQDVKGVIAKAFSDASTRVRRNLIIGEWSCALTPQSLASEQDAEQVMKEFCTEQMKVYEEMTAGWAFWSYKQEKCEGDPGWCFKTAVGRSLPSSFNSAKTKRSIAHDYSRPLTENFSPLQHRIGSSHESLLSPRTPYRFEAIHQRNAKATVNDGAGNAGKDAAQRSYSRGYADGMTTASTFASFNKSKLGFTGQYVKDAIDTAGPSVVAPGTEDNYRQGFMQGLREGEAAFL